MPLRTHAAAGRCCVFLTLLAFTCTGQSQKGSKEILKEDLQRFGYQLLGGPSVSRIDIDLAFLSDDLLLVSLREWPVRTPFSTTLLFNMKEQKLVRSIELPRKVGKAVVAIQYSRFLLLSDRGWEICSVELVCGEPWPSTWPVFVSPDGSKATIGGFREQRWVELNPKYSSLQESWQNATVSFQLVPDQATHGTNVESFFKNLGGPRIAGETGWLFAKQNTTFVQVPGKQEVDLGFRGNARFVDRARVIGIREGKATMVTLDGAVVYQVSGKLHAGADFITCSSGQRFGIFELGYSGMSSWIDFGDENGPFNLARVRLFDVASGHQLFDLKWNPGRELSSDTRPAISPDGHRVAVVIRGQLRVYAIP